MTTQTIKGNLIALAYQGKFHGIAHGCNAFHTMGAGIAASIAAIWPEALKADETQTEKGDASKLGRFSTATVKNLQGGQLQIFNLYTQFDWGAPKDDPQDLDSKANRLAHITRAAQALGEFLPKDRETHLGIPLLGAGLAGGSWNEILPAIETALQNNPGTLWVVEFEP